MTNNAYNLFNNFQSGIVKAVKLFLKNNKNEVVPPVTTSLRIPAELKDFYEYLSQAENTSLNTTIVNTLDKVKEQTINDYKKSYSKINEIFDYQLNSFLKIIDTHQIDYNDLPSLLSWLTGGKVSRSEIANKDELANILDKNSQLRLSRLFGYSYDWLQDNKTNPNFSWPELEDRWYKNVQCFVRNLINNFYLDKTVERFELSFLCSDREVVNNILNRITPTKNESITPFVIAKRNVNGIKMKTYHKFEFGNINYEKCRLHFVVLINLIMEFNKHNIIDFPNGYCLSEHDHDMILDGNLHLSELFSKKHFRNEFYLDDLVGCYPCSKVDRHEDERNTSIPNLLHGLDFILINKLILWAKKDNKTIDEIIITDEVSEKIGMDKTALEKYLCLFEIWIIVDKKNEDIRFLRQNNDYQYVVNIKGLEALEEQIMIDSHLDTAFG